MRFKKLNDWLVWLENSSIENNHVILSIQHLFPIAERLDVLSFQAPIVLVAGTNGKGTTLACLDRVYRAAGYRTALATSPHLIDFKERLLMIGVQLSEEQWCAAYAAVDIARAETELSYFEFSVLAQLYLIKMNPVDVVLLEIGLGGRLDAMNIIDPDIAVITTIDLDHMDYLGDTREKIAYEKAGIIRAHCPVVCGDFDVPQAIVNQAKKLNATLFMQNYHFQFELEGDAWTWQNTRIRFQHLPIPQIPLQNAATALEVLDLLRDRLPVASETLKSALAEVALKGRLQRISSKPEVILDVAHNPHAAAYLAEQIHQYRHNQGKLFAVVGMKKDKDIEHTLALMKPVIDRWFVASLTGARAASAADLMTHLQNDSQGFDSVSAAYAQALTEATDDDTILIFGSFAAVGPVLEIIGE